MGTNLSKHTYKNILYYPATKHTPGEWPQERTVGEVAREFFVLPKGTRIGSQPDHFYWWSVVHFVPFRDNELYVSWGGFLDRPGQSPLVANHLHHGRVNHVRLNADSVSAVKIKECQSSALPNVCVHPSGQSIGYAGKGQFVLTNFTAGITSTMSKSLQRGNSYKKGVFSPDGLGLVIIAKCANNVELIWCCLDSIHLAESHYIRCHQICPGFATSPSYDDFYECVFSLDSKFVAVGASYGMIFITNAQFEAVYNICPGLISRIDDRLSNERCFDFDRRYLHTRLAMGGVSNSVYLIDVNSISIYLKRKICDKGRIKCLKYSQNGCSLAVAISTGNILLLDPDDLNALYSLDGATLGANIALCRVNGRLAQVCSMSFDTFGEHLAVSYTDGFVRIWQLQPIMNLKELCHKVVLQHVRLRDLNRLPLPSQVISNIYPLAPLS